MAAATGRFYAMNFRDGQVVSREQKLALGQLGLDDRGNVWSYVEFSGNADYAIGNWVSDRESLSLPVGNNQGFSNGWFTVTSHATITALTGKTFVSEGAYGLITGGAGIGEAFLLDEIHSNQLHVVPLREKWSTTPDDTSVLAFFFPGTVVLGGTTNVHKARGVVQVAVDVPTTDTEGPFGWVQQSGAGLVDRTGAIAQNAALTLEASSVMSGGAVAATDVVAARALGLVPAGTTPVLADIDITNNASRPFGPARHPIGFGQPNLY